MKKGIEEVEVGPKGVSKASFDIDAELDAGSVKEALAGASPDQSWADYDKKAPKTPWGPAQYAYNLARGVRFFGTASHGGIMVAKGVAQKMMSGAAMKMGMFWGGNYWYEEDAKISIPLYDVKAWRDLYNKKFGANLSEKQLKTEVMRFDSQYFKLLEENAPKPATPRPGDKIKFNKTINFKVTKFNAGDTGIVTKVTRSKITFEAKDRLFALPMSMLLDGDVEMATAALADYEIDAELDMAISGMRVATDTEFQRVANKANQPPRRMFFGKPDTGTGGMDVFYKDRGKEIAHKTVIYKRGKESQVSYSVDPDYL
jgi:hypothetical protein